MSSTDFPIQIHQNNLLIASQLVTGSVFCDWALARVCNYKKNVLVIFVGPVGEGKSYSALKCAETIMKAQGKTFDVKKNVFFNTAEFVDNLKEEKFQPGDCIVLEEVGVEHSNRNWYDKTQQLFNHILQTFRNKNLCVFMTTPDYSFIDSQARKLTQGVFEIKSRTKKYVKGSFKLLMPNPMHGTKPWFSFLRFRQSYNSRVHWAKITSERIGKPSVKLRNAYEKAAQKYKNSVIGRMKDNLEGRESQKIEAEVKKKTKEELFKYAILISDETKVPLSKVAETMDLNVSTVYEYRRKLSAVRKKKELDSQSKEILAVL